MRGCVFVGSGFCKYIPLEALLLSIIKLSKILVPRQIATERREELCAIKAIIMASFKERNSKKNPVKGRAVPITNEVTATREKMIIIAMASLVIVLALFIGALLKLLGVLDSDEGGVIFIILTKWYQ